MNKRINIFLYKIVKILQGFFDIFSKLPFTYVFSTPCIYFPINNGAVFLYRSLFMSFSKRLYLY